MDTLICLSLSGSTLAENVEQIRRYRKFVDCAELRADLLNRGEWASIERFPAMAGVPVIFTMGRVSDGGRYEGSENGRQALLLRAAGAGYRWINLEEDAQFLSVEEACAANEVTVIRSLYDVDGVPDRLGERLRRLPRRATEIARATVTPGSTADLSAILEAARATSDMKRVLTGMGPWGFPVRVLAGKFSCLLSVCSAEESGVASGHLDPETLVRIYRFRLITPHTPLYGVIGNPVMHSRSPLIHNTGFERLGIDAVYIPFQVDDVARFLSLAASLGVRGLSVTVPHKATARSLAVSVSEAVRTTGSCNTLLYESGGWRGENSDARGFLQPLVRRTGAVRLRGMRATVIGAGGTARSVVHALRSSGAEVCVLNRTLERAEELARRFGCVSGKLGPDSAELISSYRDLIVQTTSVGMHPDPTGDPLPFYRFTGSEIVYDVVYTPEVTSILRRAADAGCTVIGGREMLLEQAYVQFRLFTGHDYPESDA